MVLLRGCGPCSSGWSRPLDPVRCPAASLSPDPLQHWTPLTLSLFSNSSFPRRSHTLPGLFHLPFSLLGWMFFYMPQKCSCCLRHVQALSSHSLCLFALLVTITTYIWIMYKYPTSTQPSWYVVLQSQIQLFTDLLHVS